MTDAAQACQRQYREAVKRHLADAAEFEAHGEHFWAQQAMERAVLCEDAIADEQILEVADFGGEVH